MLIIIWTNIWSFCWSRYCSYWMDWCISGCWHNTLISVNSHKMTYILDAFTSCFRVSVLLWVFCPCFWVRSLIKLQDFAVVESFPYVLLHDIVMVGVEYNPSFIMFLKVVVTEFLVVLSHESICTYLKKKQKQNRDNWEEVIPRKDEEQFFKNGLFNVMARVRWEHCCPSEQYWSVWTMRSRLLA